MQRGDHVGPVEPQFVRDLLRFQSRLLGEKLVLTEFVAYSDLAGHLAAISRGEAMPMDPRSIVIVSYALSGFSNFASIAIQIGGIAPLAPSRRGDIARLGLKAMVGGALASYMLASKRQTQKTCMYYEVRVSTVFCVLECR